MLKVNDEYALAGVTRPFHIADFAQSNAERPTVRPVTLAELADLEPATLFESPAWLRAYGIDDLIAVATAGPNGFGYPLLFAVRDRHLVHVGRLLWFEAACIDYLADALLDETGADFVVFEDVQVEGPLRRTGRSAFSYQRNWRIVLTGADVEAHINSGKSRSTLRRKQRAMENDLDAPRIALEEHPSRELLESIVALNKMKIESMNKKHGIDADEMDRLCAVVAEIGHVVALWSGDRVIAGDVICTVGRRAYYLVGGYDMELSRYSPGVMVHNYAIEDCRRRGMLDFNMLWGDGVYKRRLGGEPRELSTVVVRRSAAVRFTARYLHAVGPYHWFDFKARVKPLVRRHQAR